MIVIKPFLQILASVFLILVTSMIHHDYYQSPSSTDADIFPIILFALLIGFLGLHYAIFQTLFSTSLLFFLVAFLVTANHLHVSRRRDIQSQSVWTRTDVLLLELGWLLLVATFHPDPIERAFIVLAMFFILILWVKVATYYRQRCVSDHPVYALIMLAWVFIAYRMTKTDF